MESLVLCADILTNSSPPTACTNIIEFQGQKHFHMLQKGPEEQCCAFSNIPSSKSGV